MCSGHAFGVHWIDLEDQRRVGAMLLGCLGVLGGPERVLGSSWEALGVILEVWAILGSVPGGQNVAVSVVLGGILRIMFFL